MSLTISTQPYYPEPPAKPPAPVPVPPEAPLPPSSDPAMVSGSRITSGLVDRTAATIDAAPATAFPGAANGVTGKIDGDLIEHLRATVQETMADYLSLRNFTALETMASRAAFLIVDGAEASIPTNGVSASVGQTAAARSVTDIYLDRTG